MKKYCLFVREDLAALGDAFFEAEELYGMRSDTYMYKALRNALKKEDIDLHTQYKQRPEDCEVIICLNETGFFQSYKRSPLNRKLLLILTEPPVYNAKDWLASKHRVFDAVLSYAEELLERDRNKYHFSPFPIQFSARLPELPDEQNFAARKLSSMVAGAFTITKGKPELKSLLHERYRILKWFNRHAPSDLDFFSRTEPREKFLYFRASSYVGRLSPALRQAIAARLFRKNLQGVYKGAIKGNEKTKVMARYRFNFCLENTFGIRGLISEKIFDCFEAGTVPIYYGAPDINRHIPKSCFIPYEDFSSMRDLHHFLRTMDYSTYLSYLQSAQLFLQKEAAYFSVDHFVKQIRNLCQT